MTEERHPLEAERSDWCTRRPEWHVWLSKRVVRRQQQQQQGRNASPGECCWRGKECSVPARSSVCGSGPADYAYTATQMYIHTYTSRCRCRIHYWRPCNRRLLTHYPLNNGRELTAIRAVHGQSPPARAATRAKNASLHIYRFCGCGARRSDDTSEWRARLIL